MSTPRTATVQVESLAHGGDGVAREPSGRVVFVPFTCPGDIVRVEITQEKSDYARARVTEVVEASPSRVEPACPYFGSCGGCQWQHVSYETQLAQKRSTIRTALRRLAHLDADVPPPLPSAEQYGYRNRIELQARGDRGLELGFSPSEPGPLVQVDTCHLLPPEARSWPRALRGALGFLAGRQAVEPLRVVIRTSTRTGDSLVEVWTRPGGAPRGLVAKAVQEATGCKGVVRVLFRPDDGRRAVRGAEVLAGRGAWSESLAGVRFLTSATSFFQANTAVAETLVRAVLDSADSEGMTVLDAYAGVGTFTVPLARAGHDVTAVEPHGPAVRDLRRNLEQNGANARVLPGTVERSLSPSVLGEQHFDWVVLDPPRSGLTETAVEVIAGTGARLITYVSCDPMTFARDVARLTARGFTLRSVQPVDMFPQTFHAEVVSVLASD